MKVRNHRKRAPRRMKRWALWLVPLGGVALAIGAAIALGRAGQTGTPGPESPEVEARTAEYASYDQSVILTPQQERERAEVLAGLPSPCCRNHTMAGTCCKCVLSKTISGLAKHLIAERDYDAAHVRAGVLEWLQRADKEGFPGHACSTREGCRRPFNQHGCGGMEGRRS